MKVFGYICLLLFFRVQGDNINNSINEQCIYLVNKYKYISKSIFHYIPTTIINQTTLNIIADVYYYQSKLPCNQSFIKLDNLIINPFLNDINTKQLEKSILQIFIKTSINIQDIIILNDYYYNNTNQYHRIKTIRINDNQFIGNSIFTNYLLNKIFSSIKTTCEIIININEEKLENNICISTIDGLLTINRQINFDSKIDNFKNENLTLIQLKIKTKNDFDILLKQFSINNQLNFQYELINLMNNELDDEELNKILFLNTDQYSNNEWMIINQNIIYVTRYQATEYILKNFYYNQSIIEQHFNLIEKKSKNFLQKNFFIKYFNNSCEIFNLIYLRLLIFISQDNLTIQCILNRNNNLYYRFIAFRILNNKNNFQKQFHIILNDEQESTEIRIIAFQYIYLSLNISEINHLIETVQSNQLRYYMKSLFKQSSMWLKNSGLYLFPFGKINIIFNENFSSIIPNIIQLEYENNTEIDFYFLRNNKQNMEWKILLIFDKKSMIYFSTINDLFKWLNNEQLFEIETLDEFYLKIYLKIDFHFKWFIDYFNQFKNFFKKSTAGINLKIQHGLGNIITGYERNFNLESNFKINIHQYQSSTSYIWRSIQKENILFKIEQTINPLMGYKQILLKNSSSSSIKDFCYIIPHFDSKICLSFIFERFWPSSISIRLLSDDPSLIYNLTSSNNFIYFNIQHNQQIFRSYNFIRKYNEYICMPYYLEFSTPTTNYTLFINWNNENIISFNLFNNNQLIVNGSGLYQYDLLKRLSVNLTEIYPNHIGKIFIIYNGNLTINASKLFDGELIIQIDQLFDWKHSRIEIKTERIFVFFKQNFLFYFYYNIYQSSFNLTLIRNENKIFQWMFIKDNSYFYHLFIINTTLIEFDHHTQIQYDNSSNMGFQSSSLINGWSLWNISIFIINSRQIQIQLNRFFFNSQIDDQSIQFEMNYLNEKLLRSYFHINQSNIIEIPGYHYESNPKLSANYTDFSLDFPIIETILQKPIKKSNIHIEFSSLHNNLILNITSNIRNEYSFKSIHNLTFLNKYLYQLNIKSSLIMIKMIHYQLLSFYLFSQYVENSTILQLSNGSIIFPSLFFSKPFLFNYKKDSQLFIQIFEWINLTKILTNYNISTIFGLQLTIINNLSTKISINLEQKFINKHFLLAFEIDHNWIISLILNKKIRYELILSPINSIILLKRININTNKTDILPINFYINNQTLIRIEILFSKYFSIFFNDFILDISLKNDNLKLFCYIPLFKKEFFSFIWNKYFYKEFFHFHGLIKIKFLQKRHFINYEYNWNLSSIYFWTFYSNLSLFSFDPIEFYFNLTNDYLWNRKYSIDFLSIFSKHQELIRFNHKYYYQKFLSNFLFNLYFINSYYDLNLNYYHLNNSIQGKFLKNKSKYNIEGYWNTTTNILYLNTQYMKTITTITSTFIKSIIDINHQKIGFLIQRIINHFKNDTQIIECNPYLIIESYPQLFLIHYYTLNDGLSTMIFQWSIHSYFSWNYTNNGQIIFPITKFEIDIRKNYIFRINTLIYKYSSIYNKKKHQLIIYRKAIIEDIDDYYEFKIKYNHNQTFLIHLQILNNHYEIIGNPYNDNLSWKFYGYFQKDQFNGSLIISNNDWLLSSKLNFNSSLYISTGEYVQFISTLDSQISFEILLKNQIHFVLQYTGLKSLILLKFFHNSSNINLYFLLKSINKTKFNIIFQYNNLLNQNWIFEINDKNYSLYNSNYEFIFNFNLKDFLFKHFIKNQTNEFFINENIIQYLTNNFAFIISNLSSNTTKYIHLYHRQTKQNLTINYYKYGRFSYDNYNIQTSIYDINILYYPNDDDENRYVKIFFEFLPLQMSSFYFVRGRSFRIGYQTKEKQLILSGNLAFSIEDIDDKQIIIMNERWKLIYGIENREKIYIKWNIKIDSKKKTLQGRMNIQDPNDEMSIPIYSDINAHLKDMMIAATLHTVYSSSENLTKPIILQLNIDQRIITQQYISMKLIHESSKTNLSFTIDHYPQRKLHIRLKSNNLSDENTLIHLYANTTKTQLKFLFILFNEINFNLTLPKSYPKTGLLHSSLFIENDEYFDGYLDTKSFKLRTKEYLFNISFNQLILQKKFNQNILASIITQWIERNSSTALITIFSKTDFKRISIPIWISTEQKTWLKRFKQFLFVNNLTIQFFEDFQEFFNYIKTDFINEHGQFGIQLINYLNLDEDFKLGLQRINYTTMILIETLFQIGFFSENLIQEYLNNLTCLINHQNLLHLNISQLITLTIDSFIYEIIYYVNKTLIIFNHFTYYPHSMNAIISYISNDIILNIYKFLNNLYIETKKFFLSKFIQYSYELDFLLKISPFLSDSITYFSSNDIRTIIYLINDRLRQLLSLWLNSPIEYKIMKTITNQLIEFIDKFRFYLDDKLDFLLPTLQIYTPRLWTNISSNQTFLLTWSKQYNLTNIIDEK